MSKSDSPFEYSDGVLTVIGFVGGFGLSISTAGLWGGVTGGLVAVLFTLLVLNIDPCRDPALGPHQ